jgi:transposase InsO family protein
MPFPHRALRRATEPLELIHGDLCGPITPATPSGNWYFLLLVDDYSRFLWVVLLPTKDGAPAAIKNVQVAAERNSGKQLRALRTDRGGEFTVNHFKEYFEELGVQRQLTYSPQQNGVVEQRNQTVVGAPRSVLKVKDLSGTFWGEAVMLAIYVLNWSSSKGAGGRTPYGLWTGSTSLVHHLRTFRCVAHVKNMWPHLQKLEDRSKPMIFVGYEPRSMAYRVYDPTTKHVHITHDVVFDEEGKWSWDCDKIDSEFIIEYVAADLPEVVITRHGEQVASPVPGADAASPCSVSPVGEQVSPGPVVMHASPPAGAEAQLDVDHDGAGPLWFRTLQNIMEARPAWGWHNRSVMRTYWWLTRRNRHRSRRHRRTSAGARPCLMR